MVPVGSMGNKEKISVWFRSLGFRLYKFSNQNSVFKVPWFSSSGSGFRISLTLGSFNGSAFRVL